MAHAPAGREERRRLAGPASRWQHLAGSRQGRRALRVASGLFSLSLAAYLVVQLDALGWPRVLSSVPRVSWFYVLFVPLYLAFPLYEGAVWRILWGCPLRRSFPALIRKRMYSRYVLDYFGEVYLYLWSGRHVDLPARERFHTLKDNAILSSTASTLVAVGALTGLFLTGQVALPSSWMHGHRLQAGIVLAGALLAGGMTFRFRRRLLRLPRGRIAAVLGLHGARLGSVLLLELLMWVTAHPEVPLRGWLSLLAADIVITRIPFLPQRDLVLLGAGLRMAGGLHVRGPGMAGMLLTVSVLEKTVNLLLVAGFALISLVTGRRDAGRLC